MNSTGENTKETRWMDGSMDGVEYISIIERKGRVEMALYPLLSLVRLFCIRIVQYNIVSSESKTL